MIKKSCQFSERRNISEVGDPNYFSENDKEWIQITLGFLQRVWSMPQHLHFTEDIDHFNSYSPKEKKSKKTDYAGCDTTTGFIWINPKKHNTDSKTQLLNSLVHETLHCIYPNKSERYIRELANKLVGINEPV